MNPTAFYSIKSASLFQERRSLFVFTSFLIETSVD
jgi:hypothetical protein